MTSTEQLNELEASWEIGVGFLGKLRVGVFDQELCNRFIELLEAIDLEEEIIPKRAASLLWYIPLFMEWQKDRLKSMETAEYAIRKTKIEGELERILGIP